MAKKSQASRGISLTIRPVAEKEQAEVLEVYKHSEDFLALGPDPVASLEKVHKDIQTSRENHGIFCGIFQSDGKMIGVVDYIPTGFKGNPNMACLALVMIAQPYRSLGLGQEVVRQVEDVICETADVRAIHADVQVNNPRALAFWQRLGYRQVGEPSEQPDGTVTVPLCKKMTC